LSIISIFMMSPSHLWRRCGRRPPRPSGRAWAI